MSIATERANTANSAGSSVEAKRRKRHAARKSRLAAAALSMTATGVLTASFAHADRAEAATTTSTFVGAPNSNRWGEVQVRLSVKNGKISDVAAVKLPSHTRKSVRLSTNAASILRSTTLSTHTAPVDTISGASMTSRSYIASLQSAIDKARAAGALS